MKQITKDLKFPVKAGMQMANGSTIKNKIRVVGFKIVRFYYDVYTYENGHQDFVLTTEKTIKTVIH